MEKIKWLRNSSFACFGFSIFTCIPLYIDNWEIKYLFLCFLSLFLGSMLLIIYLLVENTTIKKQSAKEKEKLSSDLKKANRNKQGLQEMIRTYKKENSILIKENRDLNSQIIFLSTFNAFLFDKVPEPDVKKAESFKESLMIQPQTNKMED